MEGGPAWAYGCDKCRFGLLTWELHQHLDIIGQSAAFQMGDLQVCNCKAGCMKLARLTSKGYETDKELSARLLAQAQEHKRMKLFADAGVPPTFADLTMKSYVELAAGDEGKHPAITAIREYFDKGETGGRCGIMLWGESGVGKTGALSPLFMSLLKRGHPGLWVQYNELMAELRKFDEGHVEDRTNAIKHIKYLFIDDMAYPNVNTATRWESEVMFRVIDYRSNYRKPTFITSNKALHLLDDYYREGMTKRLAELCAIIQVTGKKLGAVSAIQF